MNHSEITNNIDAFDLPDLSDEPTEEISLEDKPTEEMSHATADTKEFNFRPKLNPDPKQELINQIFAAGVNSYNKSYVLDEQNIVHQFLKLEFSTIAPTWKYLAPEVQFKIFSQYVAEFKEFMLVKEENKNAR